MELDVKGFYNLTQSLSLYHRITADKLIENVQDDLAQDLNYQSLEDLYVDLLPNDGVLNKVLERRTTFLSGRRGTGKSTIFSRAQHEIHKQQRDLSVYLNAKSVYKNCEVSNVETDLVDIKNKFTDNEILKLTLVKKLVEELTKSLIEELNKEKEGIIKKVSNFLIRDRKLDTVIDELKSLVENPQYSNINKLIFDEEAVSLSEEVLGEMKAAINECNFEAGIKYKESSTRENSNINILARIFNIGEIIDKFLEILDICGRECLYIFIDDYSELSKSERSIFMNTIISPMYHLGVDKIHLKVACYPNKLDPISLDTGKYSIKSIDLYDVYGRDNTIPSTEKMASEYTKRLLENRCKFYCTNKIEDYFDVKNSESIDDYYKLLYQISINVPRVLGHVLNECYFKNIVYSKPITLSSIKEASSKYYYEHIEIYFKKHTAVKSDDSKLDIFVQESLKNAIVNMAQKNKYELTKTSNSIFDGLSQIPTSHFTISQDYEQYMDDLEFNGFIHKLNTLAAKSRKKDVYKNETNFLYALDYGLCITEKIIYGKPDIASTKFFQQRAFEYDDTILSVLKDNKKIICKNCNSEFSIDELEMFKKFKMKCRECDDGICEIEFDRALKNKATEIISNAILNDYEFDILYAIKLLSKAAPSRMISASLIGGETDYSSQFIARRCKELSEGGYIERTKPGNLYFYNITSRAEKILDDIISSKNLSII